MGLPSCRPPVTWLRTERVRGRHRRTSGHYFLPDGIAPAGTLVSVEDLLSAASAQGVPTNVSFLRQWWQGPDRFDWTSRFLIQRGLLRHTQLVMAVVAGTAATVALGSLPSLRWSRTETVVLALIGAAFTLGATAFWLYRWPTRRQSQIAIVAGTLFIAEWSALQPTASVAVLAATALAVTGGYAAFFHGPRLLAVNFAVAVLTAALACWRLAAEADVPIALASFWLVVFLNLCVPLAIAALASALTVYSTRSDADPLTGLLNRRGFAGATRLLTRGPSTDTHLGLLMVDLDNFKNVNDTHGHAAGDTALRAVADLLREHSPAGAALCRAGGEEFLIAATTHCDGVTDLAGPLCAAIATLPHALTASIGASAIELHRLRGRDLNALLEQLIATADEAMYIAKRNGGNRVEVGTAG
jgi:diguanylate cyclase